MTAITDIITTVRTFQNLRRKGFSKAWEISGMPEIGDKLVGALCWIIGIVGLLYLLSDQANALQSAADNRVAATVSKQAGEIEALRKIVAACLGDREGAIFIGGELFMCHAVSTGVRK